VKCKSYCNRKQALAYFYIDWTGFGKKEKLGLPKEQKTEITFEE